MKIGYPCINRTIGCRGAKTFRLASYSPAKQDETARSNINCLKKILEFNTANRILFFRITSDLVPFASHPVSGGGWKNALAADLSSAGEYIRRHSVRISMHPDQFNVINSKRRDVVRRTTAELDYHASVLDLMGLGPDAKIQVHAGGVYGDKKESMRRFGKNYSHLPETVKRRLVIENDDRSYTLSDCMKISEETGVPVLFDVFHHSLNSSGEDAGSAIGMVSDTWKRADGIPMADYSSQMPGAIRGRHAESIDPESFLDFLNRTSDTDFDIMLEIKDKEKSALTAVGLASGDPRFF